MVSRIACEQLTEHVLAFDLARRGEALDEERERPDIAVARVGATDSTRDRTDVVIRVVLGEQKFSRVLVDEAIGPRVAEIRCRKQTRDVRIVHQRLMADAIHLVRVNVTVVRCEDFAELLNPVLHFGSQRFGTIALEQIAKDRAFDLFEITERDDGHHL